MNKLGLCLFVLGALKRLQASFERNRSTQLRGKGSKKNNLTTFFSI